MDCGGSFKQSQEQLEVTNKGTDCIPDRSNSSSSSSSDSSQDSAVSSVVQSDPPPALQPKPDDVDSPKTHSRIHSSSRSGSTQIRLSGVLENHDPNRIPESIFSGKSSNPTEWSTASNESLFSIHMGNNSFSRENLNFFTKSEELMMNPNSSQNLPSLPPFVEPARVESKTEVTTISTGPQFPAISSQSITDGQKEVTTTPTDELRGRQSVSNSSMNSSHSFQFQLLGGEGGTPKTTSSVSTDSVTTQQQPVMKLQSTKQESMKQQSPEHQPPSHETTSASPTANVGSSWFCCFSWCRSR